MRLKCCSMICPALDRIDGWPVAYSKRKAAATLLIRIRTNVTSRLSCRELSHDARVVQAPFLPAGDVCAPKARRGMSLWHQLLRVLLLHCGG